MAHHCVSEENQQFENHSSTYVRPIVALVALVLDRRGGVGSLFDILIQLKSVLFRFKELETDLNTSQLLCQFCYRLVLGLSIVSIKTFQSEFDGVARSSGRKIRRSINSRSQSGREVGTRND